LDSRVKGSSQDPSNQEKLTFGPRIMTPAKPLNKTITTIPMPNMTVNFLRRTSPRVEIYGMETIK
jgi:hypothetical protein